MGLAVNTYDLDKTDVENINEELSEIASVSLSGSPKNENMRNPELFFVSSTTSTSLATTKNNHSRNPKLFVSSTTSTSLATTICWFSSLEVTLSTCGKKRKRSIKTSAEDSFLGDGISQADRSDRSGFAEKDSERKAKFLLYWLTTTTTTTSFTATSTLAS